MPADETLDAMDCLADSSLPVVQDREARPVPCRFLTGRAGTGKSYQLALQAAGDDATLICATTGIAAVNLGAVTLNATLGYFDTESMRDAFLRGKLTSALHKIAREHRVLGIDECSMLAGDQLDILYRGVEEANRFNDVDVPLGITLVGDFAQLPPIKAKWAFEADCWGHFAAATERLTKVWRQDAGPFLDALNAAREGNGGLAAEILVAAGLTFQTALATEFDGTTILPKNDMVNRYNDIALDRVAGARFKVTARRWGQQRKEWGQNSRTGEWGIPPIAEFKLGAYVMCLANAPDFSVVNGDCGHIKSYDERKGELVISLLRTGADIALGKIVRNVTQSERPDDFSGPTFKAAMWHAGDHRKDRAYVRGQVEYFPVRLAYASTNHKVQGLTLDRVQVDIRDRFFGMPAMAYVAISRCRTLEGLRIIGQRERFAQQVACEPKVRGWL